MIMLGIVATTRPAQLDVSAIYMTAANASPKAAVPQAIIENGRLALMSVSIASVPARLEPFTIIGYSTANTPVAPIRADSVMITDHESGAMTATYEKQNHTTIIDIWRFLSSACISSLARLATIKTLCAMVMIVAAKLRKVTVGLASHDCMGSSYH